MQLSIKPRVLEKQRRLLRARNVAVAHKETPTLVRMGKASRKRGSSYYTQDDPRLETQFGVFCVAHRIPLGKYKVLREVELSLDALETTSGGLGFKPRVDQSAPATYSLNSYRVQDADAERVLERVMHLRGFEEFRMACLDPSTKMCDRLRQFINVTCKRLI